MSHVSDEERQAVSDQGRRIHNAIRTGTVTEFDAASGKARVQMGDNTTGWIPVGQMRAGGMNVWAPPTIGEQVVVASESGDLANGVIISSINSDGNPNAGSTGTKPRLTFDDGSFIEVERAGGQMHINSSTECKLTAPSIVAQGTTSVVVQAPNVTIDGAGSVMVRAPNVTLQGAEITLSGSAILIEGDTVDINGKPVRINEIIQVAS